MHIQSVITYPDTGTDIQSQRERKKYESIDVRIHAQLIIMHKFSRALLHIERPERACSNTCKLSIICPDTEKDRGKRDIQKRGIRDVPIYVQSVTI